MGVQAHEVSQCTCRCERPPLGGLFSLRGAHDGRGLAAGALRRGWLRGWLQVLLVAGGLWHGLGGASAQAQPAVPVGPHRVILHATGGEAVVIGQVQFEPLGDGRSRFVLTMDPGRFTDHFLSMREMKCLPGGTEILCHIPYPYPQPGTVAPGQYGWLEHVLLFMYKKPADFGAKLWNGVYYQLRRTDRGLEGRPQAVDLNQIAAPPARPDVPPFKPAMRDDMPEGARWYQRLTIEP